MHCEKMVAGLGGGQGLGCPLPCCWGVGGRVYVVQLEVGRRGEILRRIDGRELGPRLNAEKGSDWDGGEANLLLLSKGLQRRVCGE